MSHEDRPYWPTSLGSFTTLGTSTSLGDNDKARREFWVAAWLSCAPLMSADKRASLADQALAHYDKRFSVEDKA
jgi:hypothetical protein